MSTVLLDPKTKVSDINRLAREQGSVLHVINNRISLVKIKQHAENAFAAIDRGCSADALVFIQAAQREFKQVGVAK